MAQSQDPMAALESMMANVPGGSYLLTMLKNNPEAMRALASIDQNDPSSIQKSMKVLLGAFGIQGAQADAMMAQTMQMMQNPAEMQRMAAMMPGGMPGGMPGMSAMPGAGASSTTFWCRRCNEQSRSWRCTQFPCVSAKTWISIWRGRSR